MLLGIVLLVTFVALYSATGAMNSVIATDVAQLALIAGKSRWRGDRSRGDWDIPPRARQ